ncbi:MAG: hypothetical protein H3C30_18980 [Candidatus Hydrogenedentes bacterium]|nr:hypothetical protein [Candidatus Hydrogenedentota bacterium]
MTRRPVRGYIFVETLVAMGILSVSMLFIQEAIRQAILTRGQAQDYTTARFLIERVIANRMIAFEQPEGESSGVFPAPFERFSYQWEVRRVEIPQPPLPPDMTPDEVVFFNQAFKRYLGKVTVRIRWSRAGIPGEAVAETLLRPDMVWMPPPPEGEFL